MAKRRSSSNMLIGAAVLVGAGYWLLSRKSQAATGAGLMTSSQVTLPPVPLITPNLSIPEIPGAIAPTGSQVTASQAIWQNLTSTSGPNTGYVNFPSGSQSASAFLPWATDGSGNYYTQWAGQIYIVGVAQPDASGNYPAKLLGS